VDDPRFVCKQCGGLVVDANLEAPLFAQPPESGSAPAVNLRRTRTSGRRWQLPRISKEWRPLIVAWMAAGVFILVVGGYSWRTLAHQVSRSEHRLLAAQWSDQNVLASQAGRFHGEQPLAIHPSLFGAQEPAAQEPAPLFARRTDNTPAPPAAGSNLPLEAVESRVESDDPSASESVEGSAAVAAAGALLPEAGQEVGSVADGHQQVLFPFTLSLPDVDGKKLDLTSLCGKVVIVDLWGTWCPPCRLEIPNFVQLKNKYGDAGLEIVGVNFESPVLSRARARALVKRAQASLGINYRCVVGTTQVARQVPDFRALPTTLILDRHGQVRSKFVGYHSLEQLEAIVQPLLAEDDVPGLPLATHEAAAAVAAAGNADPDNFNIIFDIDTGRFISATTNLARALHER
jgi:thiol-disulfide isomerase/thioredoxin